MVVAVINTMDSTLTEKAQAAFRSKLLTGPKFLLLMLHNHKQGGQVVADLAKLSQLSHPTLNNAKEALLSDEMVEEYYPLRDKRTVKVYLTKKGRAEANKLWKGIEALCEIKENWLAQDLT